MVKLKGSLDAAKDMTSRNIAVGTKGEITKPLQPSFLGTMDVAANVTGDGTNFTVITYTEIFDRGANFNSTSGVFTAPVTGIYGISYSIWLNGLTAANTLLFSNINTSNRNYRVNQIDVGTVINADDYAFNGIVFCDMDAGDTAHISVAVAGTTKVVDILQGTFSGALIA